MFRDKLTKNVERLAEKYPVVPVIIKAKHNKFKNVYEAVYSAVGDVGKHLLSNVSSVFPILNKIESFNMVSAILPKDWIYQLAEAREVEKIYQNKIMTILSPINLYHYPTVNKEEVYTIHVGPFKEPKQFTTVMATKKLIGADIANASGYNGSGVKVAIIDTGASRLQKMTRHLTLDSVMKTKTDSNGHGTWTSACICGYRAIDERTSRIIGKPIVEEGIAPNAWGVAIKALGHLIGTGSTCGIIKAIELAVYKYGVDVISMSLGGKSTEEKPEDDPYYEVFEEVVRQGVIPVVAAGNSGPNPKTIATPGCLPQVLTVGAYDPITGELANFSSRGPCLHSETWIYVVNDDKGYSGFRRIRDIKVGDIVLAYDTKTGKITEDRVVKTFKVQLNGRKMYEIRCKSGFGLRITEDHPVYVIGKGWTMVKDLQVGDKLLISIPHARKSFGWNLPEETKLKMKGRLSPRKGYKYTEEEKKLQSERLKKYYEEHPEAREYLSKLAKERGWAPPSQKGKHWTLSEEARGKIREAQKKLAPIKSIMYRGEGNPFYGKHHTEETKEKLRMKALQQKVVPISKQEIMLYEALKPYFGDKLKQQWGVFLGPKLATRIDIAIPELKIAIYVDGEYWHSLPERKEKDKVVTVALENKGWKVLRFKAKGDVEQRLDWCVEQVLAVANLPEVQLYDYGGGLFMDEIVEIKEIKNAEKRYKYVYNIETEKTHTYLANGYVVHNCNWGDIKPDCVAPGVNIHCACVGLLDKVGDDMFNGYSILSGTSMACLPPGTLIETTNGYVPIEDVHNPMKVPSFVPDKIGGHTEIGTVTSPIAVYQGIKRCVKVKTPYEEIVCSYDHPIFAVRKDKLPKDSRVKVNGKTIHSIKSELIEEIPAEDLKPGDYVLIKRKADFEVEVPEECKNWTPDHWRLLGLNIADGYLNSRQNYRQVFWSQSKEDIREYYMNALKELGYNVKDYKGIRFYINNAKLLRIYNNLIGIGNDRTGWTLKVVNLPKEQLKYVIQGYFDGDGWIIKDKNGLVQIGFSGLPEDLKLVKLALKRFGIRSSVIHSRERVSEKWGIKGVEHYIKITGEDVYKYIENIGFCVKKPPIVYKKRDYEYKRYVRRVSDEYELQKVISIEEVGDLPVYDIRVDPDHNYIAENFVVHNTPHVSGLCVLMRQAYHLTTGKILTVDEIKRMLSIYGHEKNNDDGWGPINWKMFRDYMDTEYSIEI